ncbi:subtilisin-like serine protease PR1C [Akanthomyces lecanii RCEF 1005]|uniref:Subtilisin-like serine protease PR1C n=1 Tax=Akanthomyces lecanii RCEF 1005 TaxID=1081108 RepID=A0A168GP94_CORDF|nr:subtilisin-like serine protease PR1C [Akanthomyces lecanii RCEF 1005]
MVLFSTLTLAGLAAAASLARAATIDSSEDVSGNVATGAFILECESTSNLDELVKAVHDQGGEIRRQFKSKVFYGISVQLHNTTMTGHGMEQMPGVTKVWPVEVTKQPVEPQTVQQPGSQRRDNSAPWNHIMTQVDKLHAAGFTGSGIRIAVVDTGVNYTHSALGGCFGKGCRVVLGDNFSKDGKKNDPMDCHGHGTTVAGILAGNDANYVGVAPNATLAAYRVLDCNAMMVEDDLVAGWVKAYEDGAQLIVSSAGWPGSSWATRPAAAVVSRIVDSGVPCIVGLGNDKKAGLFSVMNPSSGKGVTSVNAFARAPGAIDGPVKDAPMARFSTYGPNWDLDIKPTVGAPGDDVPGIRNGGGYEDVSGTSFAGPFVAGIMALMAEVRGTFDPVLLNSILMSTAVPQGAPYSVAQQGGGLVRAWDAAHATTLVEPSGLAFNDTQHRAQSLSLSITNTAKTNVTYHLDTLAAETLYTLIPGIGLEQSPPVQESADIKLSQSVLVLGPGKSAAVDISATDPSGLDGGRLPVWSGWIKINSSNSDVLTVPYLGLSGSLKEHQVLPSWGAKLATFTNDPVWGPLDNSLYDGDDIDYKINNDSSLDLSLPLSVKPEFGTRLVRAEVVPIAPRKWLADRMQAKNLKINAFTMEALSHTQTTRTTWNGRLEWGDYLPVGTYKLVVRALRLFGDSKAESDWDTSETVTFQVRKGAGEKACKVYEPGQAKIPDNALFDSHQECLDVQGDALDGRPWIPEPQDAAMCTDDDLTEKACGTYRFCKAHEDAALSHKLKSPFKWSSDCARSHKMLPAVPGDMSRIQECVTTKDESICGTQIWCDFGFSSPQFGNGEECKWAHGKFS